MNNFHELYRVAQLPIFQNRMYDTAEEARTCPKGDMLLVEDLRTGLVYNAAFRPELMVYDKCYQNEQACSRLFQQHLEKVACIIDQRIGREQIVEIGCGKGHFLETLLAKGFDINGFDPAYEGSNPRIQREYFAPGAIEKAKGLILRHVLEHIENPVNFLEQLKIANNNTGLIYIEVPCFDWICKNKAWFDVFYEHVNYFRITDFDRIFGEVIESGHFFGGQYIYAIAELASLRAPVINNNDRVKFPKNFTKEITTKKCQTIWGGASKGVIFSLLMERSGFPVEMVIDINPEKQGKFLPGTGLVVKSPEQGLAELQDGSTICVMNPLYLEEINNLSGNIFNCVGINDE
ncbi:class I SAM-dependent methyltransferase [Azonexus hydrophilus]|uniref:Class I SAM-dependent methyltransferase n=1 Tax=Azonexus hydrophilus TaxID=418702 RepID=A0ABZ2XIF9_9RHOO